MEPFKRGELVALRDSAMTTMGRVVSVSDDGRRVEVRWHTPPEQHDRLTVEDSSALRRVHESEMLEESA